MSKQVSTGAVHHVTLTVCDIRRSMEFYTSFLGFRDPADPNSKEI